MDAECVFKRTMILGKNFIIMLQCAVTNYMGWSFLTFLQTVFLGLLLYIGITKRPEISVKSPVVPGSANYRLDNQCFREMFKMKIIRCIIIRKLKYSSLQWKIRTIAKYISNMHTAVTYFLNNTEVCVKGYKICKTL